MSGVASVQTIPGVTTMQAGARFGVKGADAATWLAQRSIVVPDAPNCIARWEGGRCLRLGNTEFLVELDAPDSPAPSADDNAANTGSAWLLQRSDHSLLLTGAPWPDELARVCSFDFERWRDEPDLVVMTLLAGIGVTLALEPAADGHHALRLWCDASYAPYLNDCLHQLAATSTPGDTR
jgi:sarcosine oxidase subunit gamma